MNLTFVRAFLTWVIYTSLVIRYIVFLSTLHSINLKLGVTIIKGMKKYKIPRLADVTV